MAIKVTSGEMPRGSADVMARTSRFVLLRIFFRRITSVGTREARVRANAAKSRRARNELHQDAEPREA